MFLVDLIVYTLENMACNADAWAVRWSLPPACVRMF